MTAPPSPRPSHPETQASREPQARATPPARSSGFTLIEVIIALAIFATLTATLISISNSINIIAALRAYQVSAWVADNHVEFARIDGLEKNLTYTSSLFGAEYISKMKPLEEPFKEIFPDDPYLEGGKVTASVNAPSCKQVYVSVYREYAGEPEFTMLACIFPKQEEEGEGK